MSIDPHLVPHWDTVALVTIDVQRDFLSESPYGIAGTTEILPNLGILAKAFRGAGRPIVHIVRIYEPGGGNADLVRRSLLGGGARIAAPGSEGSQLAPGLAPDAAPELDHARLLAGETQELGPREYAIFKPRWGAFYQTPLQDELHRLGVDSIVFAGCNFPNCPRASIIQASERDYRVIVATDALSQGSEQGLREVSRMGVQLMTTDDVVNALG
ncbi:cysteine hydrolase [Acrocarpospora macrocephala]|uniref:Hypothetical isochorismatase hydrolase n=1 Tax=Acrocarpospora macrocephala TaxID=150177 RepID=A0A5M3WUZ8_9ACTN|nr:isochorismatase family cysteine hydrolase [Acrocarpospora macrocephala]GES12530.1 hypothetical isochorismatase hydrolase [Acrocarpospora macrocephala]